MPDVTSSVVTAPTPDRGLVAAFVAMSSQLYASEDLDDTLGRITRAAVDVVGGCEVCSVTMREDGALVTRAPTAALAVAGDALQYEVGEGPCLDATLERGIISVPDSVNDPRWPTYSGRAAAELGVRSMVSCQLTIGSTKGCQSLGGINLYATTPEAFSEEDLLVCAMLAAHASVLVDASQRQRQLREAIESRDVIGQAKGILMARGGVSSNDAFEQLKLASQRVNVKLKDLAAEVVERRQRGDP